LIAESMLYWTPAEYTAVLAPRNARRHLKAAVASNAIEFRFIARSVAHQLFLRPVAYFNCGVAADNAVALLLKEASNFLIHALYFSF